MKAMKITSGALWALLGALLASAFVVHTIRGMLAFTPASQTTIARERTAANQVGEFIAPTQCDEYSAPMRVRYPSETYVGVPLQDSQEGTSQQTAQYHADGWRNRANNAPVTPPQVLVTGSSWVSRSGVALSGTWSPPHRVLGGQPVEFLSLANLIKANPGRWSVRRHDIRVVDLPSGTPRPANTLSTTWVLSPLAANDHPRAPDTDRYTVDTTTISGINMSYQTPVTGEVVLASLFTAPASPAPVLPNLNVVTHTANWKVYALPGMLTIPRVGLARSVQTACGAITEVATTINTPSDGQRRRLVGLISRLDGADTDPSASSDLQHVVRAAKDAVTAKLESRLDEDQRTIDSLTAMVDHYRSLYAAYWNFFEVRVPAQITELENVLIGSNGIVLLLALVFTLLALDMRRKLSKLPPAPPSTSVITEIQYAFLASMEAELFQLLSFVRANIAAGHEDYNWVHKELTQGTLISALMEDPPRLLRLARLLAEAEIQRLGPRHTPAEPMPAAKAGLSIDSTFAKAIEELCLAITDAAGVARPAAKMDLVWLVARAAGSVPHALDKAGKAALAAHTCPVAPKAETGSHKAASMTEAICRRILTTVGEDVAESTSVSALALQAINTWDRFIAKIKADALAAHTCPPAPPPADKALMDELEELVDHVFRACGMSPMGLDEKLSVDLVRKAVQAINTFETVMGLITRTLYEMEPSTTELVSEVDTAKLGEHVLRSLGKLKTRIADGVAALERKHKAFEGVSGGFKRLEGQLDRFSSSVQKALPTLEDSHPAKAIIRDALAIVHLKEEHKKTEKYRAANGKPTAGDDSGEIVTSQGSVASTA